MQGLPQGATDRYKKQQGTIQVKLGQALRSPKLASTSADKKKRKEPLTPALEWKT